MQGVDRLTTELDSLSLEAIWATYGVRLIDAALNLIAAIAILIVGFWLAGRIARGVRRLAQRHPNMDVTVAGFIAQIVRYAVLAIVLLAVLGRFGVQTASVVAVLGAATLAIGLALQGTLSNVAAGVMLVLFRPYRIGDVVETAGQTGVIKEVGLFTTTLDTFDGVRVVMPNGLCWAGPIRNFSTLPSRRVELVFNVSYDTDLNHAIAVIRKTVEADARVLREPEPVVRVTNLGDYSVDILAFFHTSNADFWLTGLDMRKSVKEALDAAHINIPFPTALNYEVRTSREELAEQDVDGADTRPPSG
jgi:small conductance mechanosensitive channel